MQILLDSIHFTPLKPTSSDIKSFCFVVFYSVLSDLILSNLILSNLILSHLILSYLMNIIL